MKEKLVNFLRPGKIAREEETKEQISLDEVRVLPLSPQTNGQKQSVVLLKTLSNKRERDTEA